MKKVQLTKEEIIMLLHGIQDWRHEMYRDDSPDPEDSGFTKKQLRAMESAQKVLINILNA